MRWVAPATSSSVARCEDGGITWVFSASAGDGAEAICRVFSSAGSCVPSGSLGASVIVVVIPHIR
jgi:hypothetical protein